MFDHRLKQYFVDNDINPIILEATSRSTKNKVMMAYFPHAITGDEYANLSRLTRNLFTSCALDLKHLLLIPTSDLGKNINLMDAIDTASYHLEGKTPRRISHVEVYDLSSLEKTPEPVVEKKTTTRKPRATSSAAKKSPAARKAPAKKAPVKKAPAKKAPAKKAVAKKAPAKRAARKSPPKK